MFKKIFSVPIFLLFALFTSTTASAKFLETNRFSDILPEIDQETLVLVDIDETILTMPGSLGTTACWDHFIEVLSRLNFDKKNWFPALTPTIYKITRTLPAVAVEPDAASVIRSLQERGITVWSLTGRDKEAPWDRHSSTLTRNQLNSLGVDFEKSALPAGVLFNTAVPPKNYAYGIIFTNQTLKGPVLVEFLTAIQYRPKKIVMIDDLHEQLVSLHEELDKAGIPVVCVHYKRLKEREENLDPMIVNIQLQELMKSNKIISDEEAKQMKQKMLTESPGIAADFYLEELFQKIKQEMIESKT